MDETLTIQQILDIFSKVIDQKAEKRLEEAELLVNAYSTREDATQPDAFLEFIRMLMVGYMKTGAEIMIRTLQDQHMLCTKRVAQTGDA